MKRYVVILDAYIYAENDKDVMLKLRNFKNEPVLNLLLNKYHLSRLDVVEIHEAEFGKLTTRKL